ncbi:MAG: hypothetical protein JW910_18015 [Anaerolineae bacterium]|nr:hypothetical protein [Anaerolineae bacterium]
MSFFLLAQADPVGRDLLKKLVVARYGGSPPALDTLRVKFQGRSRAQVWGFQMWARVEATATYQFPDRYRWDFSLRLLRVLRSSFTTSFDGSAVYEQRGLRATRDAEAEAVESARRRAWAETVFFVSPLIVNERVRVEGIDMSSFRAIRPGGSVENAAIVRLDEQHRLREIEIERMDPADGLPKRQCLRPSGDLVRVDGLVLPQRVGRFWDDELFMELSPVGAELNPELSPDDFVLKTETIDDILTEDDTASAADGETPDR